MKIKKASLTLLLLFVAVMIGGCTETESNDVVVNYNTTESFAIINDDNIISSTIIVEENKNLTVTGKVVEINFRRTGDIIVFEDGCILSAYPAKSFVWKIGEVHQIKMEKVWGDNYIKSVKITEVSDEK